MSGLTYYRWRYTENTLSRGACANCGEAIEAPVDTGYTEQLVSALKHPARERRLLAAQMLGRRGDSRAIGPLRDAALGDDPYVAAAALTSLMTLDPIGCNALAEQLGRIGSAPVRAAAQSALATPGRPGAAGR
jgi:HEAT repeats